MEIMMKTKVRRIVICQSDEVPPQGAITGSTAREARATHPTLTVPAGRLPRAVLLPTHVRVRGRGVLGTYRRIYRIGRIHSVILCSISIHSSDKC